MAEVRQHFTFFLTDDRYDIAHIKNYKNVKSGELTHFLTKTAYKKIKTELRKIKDSDH